MAKTRPIDPISSEVERTASIHIYSQYGQPKYAQFFREGVTTHQSGLTETDLNPNPYTIKEEQLPALLKFITIPEEYKALFPDIQSVGKGLQGLSPLLSMLGDAVEAWSIDQTAKLKAQETAPITRTESNAV
jgi:hypothetical protein